MTAIQPLAGTLVADVTRYTPGAFASRELVRLGARVVRVEPPEGDPLRAAAPAWHDELNAGKESVVVDLKRDPAVARELCLRADVVLEGFRPGVADRLGLEPGPRTSGWPSPASAPATATSAAPATTSTTSAGRASWTRRCRR